MTFLDPSRVLDAFTLPPFDRMPATRWRARHAPPKFSGATSAERKTGDEVLSVGLVGTTDHVQLWVWVLGVFERVELSRGDDVDDLFRRWP